MRDPDEPKKSGKTAFERGADLLAMVLAGVLTFLAGPGFFKFSVDFIVGYAGSEFGTGWEPLVEFAWVLCCAIGVFGFSLMFVAVTVRLGMAKLGKIFFRA